MFMWEAFTRVLYLQLSKQIILLGEGIPLEQSPL